MFEKPDRAALEKVEIRESLETFCITTGVRAIMLTDAHISELAINMINAF